MPAWHVCRKRAVICPCNWQLWRVSLFCCVVWRSGFDCRYR